MCSLVILYRPDHEWPLLLGANRDEMMDRPWRPPGRHWPTRRHILAGLDQMAGGSWLGMNDRGVVAAVLNRTGTLGAVPGKASRGLLVLEALDHDTARAATLAIERFLDKNHPRPFNLVICDASQGFWISWRATSSEHDTTRQTIPLSPGLHLLTSRDLDDPTDPRIRGNLPRFRSQPHPDPSANDWSAWIKLLSSTTPIPGVGPESAMCFQLENRFATVSSSLIALPHPRQHDRTPVWHFAAGSPDRATFLPVSLHSN
ncbi:MAG: NRDE family protein [Magnetococcales bacterium]|nr:NRDE family protein [Magnetococcales bacterium]